MKLLIVAALVGVVLGDVALHQQIMQAQWSNFKATHGKDYPSHEEPARLNAFLQNSHAIEVHNERFAKGIETYTLGHNQFSDMPEDEFKAKMTGIQSPPECRNATSFRAAPGIEIPKSVDLKHTTPTVKNQGSCGSCYTFAALGALEGVLHRKNAKHVLSEQNLVDCTYGGSYGNNGCNGGSIEPCFRFVKDKGGVAEQSKYPYTGKVETCRHDASKCTTKHQVSRSVWVQNKQDMKVALATVGPVAVHVHAGHRGFSMYSGGVFNDATCGNKNVDHGVVACGYGTANGQDYILIKNSWGTTWGEGGYMRLNPDICHVCKMGIYPVV